jgi:hypothetical protein
MTKHEDNRVLNRIGARDLTPKEVELVNGGSGGNNPTTTTVCTIDESFTIRDGDPGECS